MKDKAGVVHRHTVFRDRRSSKRSLPDVHLGPVRRGSRYGKIESKTQNARLIQAGVS